MCKAAQACEDLPYYTVILVHRFCAKMSMAKSHFFWLDEVSHLSVVHCSLKSTKLNIRRLKVFACANSQFRINRLMSISEPPIEMAFHFITFDRPEDVNGFTIKPAGMLLV